MDEQRLNRELDEVLAMLKTIERKMLDNGAFSEIKDIFAIHLAVLRGFKGADIVSWAEEFGEAPANHWISTKERLPESGRNVLIYYSPWEGDAVQVAKLDCDRLTFDICGEFNVAVGLVTHWMPVPESPKEE